MSSCNFLDFSRLRLGKIDYLSRLHNANYSVTLLIGLRHQAECQNKMQSEEFGHYPRLNSQYLSITILKFSGCQAIRDQIDLKDVP